MDECVVLQLSSSGDIIRCYGVYDWPISRVTSYSFALDCLASRRSSLINVRLPGM